MAPIKPASVSAANNGANGTVGTALATAPTFTVLDPSGNAMANVSVAVVVSGGGGSIVGAPTRTSAGATSVGTWTLGNTAGMNSLTVTVNGLAALLTITATGMPAKQKAQVTPGPPQSVGVTVAGPTSLRVEFTPPADNGGDDITKYKVEYSTFADYRAAGTGSVEVTYIQGGGQALFRTLTALTQGTFYYVRVSAHNSQGYGLPTSMTSAVNPSISPDGPSNVLLRITSQSMLTVSFGPPVSDGGDAVTQYLVEWDVTSLIGSGTVAGQKGAVFVSAASELS